MIPSQAVVDRAEDILATQTFVPLSPATIDEAGQVCLCAAASLAAAGVESKFGMKAAAEFRANADRMSSKALEDVFESLEWSPILCAEMRACNDAAPPKLRLTIVRSKLRQIVST